MSDYETRFGAIARLYGVAGLDRLRRGHVCVVGVGGVGSWAVEALARSGINKLTLIDMDDVCVSNVNRQLPALDGEIGKPKVAVLAERCRKINPECSITTHAEFFTAQSAEKLFGENFDYVFDAIDNVQNKCLLIAESSRRKIPIITAGGAGGRRDGTAIRITDLAQSSHDALLQRVRKKLRSDFGFPSAPKTLFGVECVHSIEPPVFPQSDGKVCATKDSESDLRLTCEGGYGTATFVTGQFGFAAAGQIVRRLAEGCSA